MKRTYSQTYDESSIIHLPELVFLEGSEGEKKSHTHHHNRLRYRLWRRSQWTIQSLYGIFQREKKAYHHITLGSDDSQPSTLLEWIESLDSLVNQEEKEMIYS